MKAKAGDLVIYQVREIDETGRGYWNIELGTVKESNVDYYNKEGIFKDSNLYVINYIIPKEKLSEYKVEEFKKIYDKV